MDSFLALVRNIDQLFFINLSFRFSRRQLILNFSYFSLFSNEDYTILTGLFYAIFLSYITHS